MLRKLLRDEICIFLGRDLRRWVQRQQATRSVHNVWRSGNRALGVWIYCKLVDWRRLVCFVVITGEDLSIKRGSRSTIIGIEFYFQPICVHAFLYSVILWLTLRHLPLLFRLNHALFSRSMSSLMLFLFLALFLFIFIFFDGIENLKFPQHPFLALWRLINQILLRITEGVNLFDKVLWLMRVSASLMSVICLRFGIENVKRVALVQKDGLVLIPHLQLMTFNF